MINISSRSRLVAAASPLALAMVMASSPALAQETPAVTGAASAATAAQPADQGAAPAPTADQNSGNIVVTGFRASLQSAINKKKKADQIVESVSAEDIGKLPDASIGEAIARLPGLTAMRGATQGRAETISIRGLGPDYSTTLLNGREQTSTGDNRAVQFDQYPSEVINQVNVYKTPIASVVGQGLTGTIDLRTIRPLEYGHRIISVGGRAIYPDIGKLNPEAKKYGYRVNGVYVDQFADGRVGVSLAASWTDEPYEVKEFNSWGYATIDAAGDVTNGGLKSYSTSTELKRLGLSGTVEFKPTDTITSTLDAFYSRFHDDEFKRGIEVPLAWGGATLEPGYTVTNGVVTSGTFDNVWNVVRNVDQQRHATLESIGWNNAWNGENGWHAFLDVSYSKTKRNELIFETYAGTGFNKSGPSDTLGFVTSDTGTFITSHNIDYGDPTQIFITSPQGWGGTAPNGAIQPGYWNNRIVHDRIWQYHGEISKDLNSSFLSNIVVGANWTNHYKTLTAMEANVALSDPTVTQLAIPSQYLLGTADFSWIGLGGTVAFDPQQLLDAGIYTLNDQTFQTYVQAKDYGVTEREGTIYGMVNIKSHLGSAELTGNIGVQAVHTDQSTVGYSALGNVLTPQKAGAKYWDVMPSANLSFRFPEDWVIRIGLAREVQRPRMDDMKLALSYGVDISSRPQPFLSGGSGNPFLRPFRANAADLSFEKYFGVKGYIAAAVFYKKVDTWVNDTSTFPVPFNYTGYPLPAPYQSTNPSAPNYVPPEGITNGVIFAPGNVSGGHLWGAELGATIPIGEFIHALDGFGVTGGLSYAQPKIPAAFPGGPTTIPGYSKFVANGTAYFEKWGFSIRGSVRHRSSFRGEVSGFGASPVFRFARPETIYDGQIGYDFQPGSLLNGLSLYLQVLNIGNSPFVTQNPGQPLQVIDYQRYGRRWMLGATYKFGAAPPPPPPPPPAPPPPPPPAPATQICPDGAVILATDACPAPPPPPPPPPPPATKGERGS